jgi:hypothetical protein
VEQGAVAETALVTLATPGLFNDVLCKNWPREFDLLIRKVSPAGLDGLPSGSKRSYEDVHGVRIKDAGLYVSVEEVAHFAALQDRRGYIDLIFAVWRVILFLRFGESSCLMAMLDSTRQLPKITTNRCDWCAGRVVQRGCCREKYPKQPSFLPVRIGAPPPMS